MKTAIRIILCTCLLAVAVTMAAFTLADLTALPKDGGTELYLAGYEGSVAVFEGGDRKTPLQVTDIALGSLRDSDRTLIEQGYPVDSREELLSLLEDLGS